MINNNNTSDIVLPVHNDRMNIDLVHRHRHNDNQEVSKWSDDDNHSCIFSFLLQSNSSDVKSQSNPSVDANDVSRLSRSSLSSSSSSLSSKHQCLDFSSRSCSSASSSAYGPRASRNARGRDKHSRRTISAWERSYPNKRSRSHSLGRDTSCKFERTLKRKRCSYGRNPKYSDLPLEWWERSEGCKIAKEHHQRMLDRLSESRESLVLQTTLWRKNTVLEPNMFPCKSFHHFSSHVLPLQTHQSSLYFGLILLQIKLPKVWSISHYGVDKI